MEHLTNFTPYKWIADGRDPPPPLGEHNRRTDYHVSHVIPPVYEAYCKLLHPMHLDPAIEDETVLWIERPNEMADPVKLQGVRILWRNVADKYGMDFDAAVNHSYLQIKFPRRDWPRYIIRPSHGIDDMETCARLVKVLAEWTENQSCFFFYICYATVGSGADLLFRGKLKEVTSFLDRDDLHAVPTYWWPADRSWCVWADPDICHSLIGGPEPLINSLLGDDVLECIRVQESTPAT
ncbi:MAG: hypothetical protein O7D31_11610 [Alphaproteobacteria bacterium]|nr:hypothetical protein [Alphaproteobacteria bacterium]